MASKTLFSNRSRVPAATARNEAGGKAYNTGAEHSLAQYACTGMFGNTYYASAKTQLDEVLKLAQQVDPEFLAKCAVYSRKKGYMKDMPAFLLAVLSTRDTKLFKKAFPQVCDNGKMVRNFVQIMRSGAVGRYSLGSAPKKMIQKWLARSSNDYLFKQSVGNDPSLADIIKMVHPTPEDTETANLYGYLTGKKYDKRKKYPKILKEFEVFKTSSGKRRVVPDVPFQMLTSQGLTDAEWGKIAENGAWQFTRMNLNNFQKHGLFSNKEFTKMIADRLKDPELVARSRAFPYQLFQAYRNTENVPTKVKNALQDALDLAVSNIPDFDTQVHIGVDSSGSMSSDVSGAYHYRTNGISCNEAASLFASAIFRQNDDARVYRFDTSCKDVTRLLNSRDSVISNADKIGRNGGGTDCASFLRLLNKNDAKGDLVIMVSDNMSWYSATGQRSWGNSGTDFLNEWKKYKKRNKKAVLVCIDITPGTTAQAVGKDVLLVGGFSDNVFNVVSKFYESKGDHTFWVREIKQSVEL